MKYAVLFVMALWSLPAAAQTACIPTPALQTQNYPGAKAIPPGNDLLKPAGKAVAASGQSLMLQGHVYDNRCIPLQGVQVELWQVDPFGKWRLATPEDMVNTVPVFAGAGRTYTQNDGSFYFMTAFPADTPKQGPRLYVKVTAAHMKPFSTILYFENDMRNANDPVYKKLSLEARERVTLRMQPLSSDPNAGFAGTIDIILPGQARYRRY